MELRQLEAFVAVATELHFGRAAERLRIGQPTLSDLIRRLERELGAELLTRTTRKVSVTGAGQELLGRAKVILDEVAAASAAVRRTAHGETGTVRVAITPPVAPMLIPHLQAAAGEHLPDVTLVVQRMWLPDLTRALSEGTADVAITCARVPDAPGVVNTVFCSEPLLVGVRPEHRLANHAEVALADLAREPLGVPSESLFPAWTLAQRQALDSVDFTAPTVRTRRHRPLGVGVDHPVGRGLDLAHWLTGHATWHRRTTHHPGDDGALHRAVESRTRADRSGRPVRQTGSDPRRPAGMAARTRTSAARRLMA